MRKADVVNAWKNAEKTTHRLAVYLELVLEGSGGNGAWHARIDYSNCRDESLTLGIMLNQMPRSSSAYGA